jgi:hypothetical protein
MGVQDCQDWEVAQVLCIMTKLTYYDSHLTHLLLARSLALCGGCAPGLQSAAREPWSGPAALRDPHETRMGGQAASMLAWAISINYLHVRGCTYALARQLIIKLRDLVPRLAHELDAQARPCSHACPQVPPARRA